MDLVILAAGMGSRFGGLKQLEPIDEYGNFIIDYSIYDAMRAGFDKIIFIIRRENEKIFKKTIGNRLESKIKVEYVYQENDSIHTNNIPNNRIKPLGTGHAILCCKKLIKKPFMIINADDYYGPRSYELAVNFIKNECDRSIYGCIAYEAGNTLAKNGSVKRGVCNIHEGEITNITESSISKKGDCISAKPINGANEFEITADTPVSMNMFILDPSIFEELESGFNEFTKNWKDSEKDEYLLPDIVSNMIEKNKIKLKLVKSPEKWYGITYKEDKQSVVDALKIMVTDKKYPKNLWGE